MACYGVALEIVGGAENARQENDGQRNIGGGGENAGLKYNGKK